METPAAGPSPDLLLRVLREVMILSPIEQQRMVNRDGEGESWGMVAALVEACDGPAGLDEGSAGHARQRHREREV